MPRRAHQDAAIPKMESGEGLTYTSTKRSSTHEQDTQYITRRRRGEDQERTRMKKRREEKKEAIRPKEQNVISPREDYRGRSPVLSRSVTGNFSKPRAIGESSICPIRGLILPGSALPYQLSSVSNTPLVPGLFLIGSFPRKTYRPTNTPPTFG